MGQKYSSELQNDLGVQFYQFCSDGNLHGVRELLPLMSYEEVNYIDPTLKNTSLHVACFNNHYEIVRLLLENNLCSRLLLNGNNQTAYHLAVSSEIRSLFNRTRTRDEKDRFTDSWTAIHQSPFRLIRVNGSPESNRPDNWVTGYFSSSEARDAQLMLALSEASLVMKFFLYSRTEREGQNVVRRLIEIHIPKSHAQHHRAHQLYEEFVRKRTVRSLLTLYSLPTPLFQALQANADAYTVILYLHLRELSDRSFCGSTYRGMVVTFGDIEAYRWAHEHAAIIETRTLQSTSKDRAVADMFADLPPGNGSQISVIVRYKFNQICPTAINFDGISHFPIEEEVLLLPFTLFRVSSIKEFHQNNVRRYQITMQNVPVIRTSVCSSSRKGK